MSKLSIIIDLLFTLVLFIGNFSSKNFYFSRFFFAASWVLSLDSPFFSIFFGIYEIRFLITTISFFVFDLRSKLTYEYNLGLQKNRPNGRLLNYARLWHLPPKSDGSVDVIIELG